MHYSEALSRLYSLRQRGIKLGLDALSAVLEERARPQDAVPVIHIAGSNGKGSTSAMLDSILRRAGLRVGFFSSPHLHRYAERFRINGTPIDEGELASRMHELVDAQLGITFFEHTTLLAFEIFRDHGCDIVVLETGLGGRLDATNLCENKLATVITHIAKDHTRILGDTLPEIAAEKAGILRSNVPVISGVSDPDACAVVQKKADEVGAPLFQLNRDFSIDSNQKLGLAGRFQHANAAVAVATAKTLSRYGIAISNETMNAGLRHAQWPGRLESYSDVENEFLFDAAHNPSGAHELAIHLENISDKKKQVLLFAVMADKKWSVMLSELYPHVDAMVFGQVDLERSEKSAVLAAKFDGVSEVDPEKALENARHLAGRGGRIIVAGSIFWLAEIRSRVVGERNDPLIRM